MRARPVAMTVAGTDSGGGAGVAADLKTFEAHGVWGTLAVAAVTAQDTTGVAAAAPVPAELVAEQIRVVASDIGIDAVKTGMLAGSGVVEAVAGALRRAGVQRLVVDPVMVSSSGHRLLADDAVEAVLAELVPMATVMTPNLAEAERLTGVVVADRAGMVEAARVLLGAGARAVLVTGGHLAGEGSPDCLVEAGSRPVWLEGERIGSPHTHGTGCVLSAAVTAGLARGMDPGDACLAAKRFVERAIAAGVDLGAGAGPVDPGRASTGA